MTFINGQFQRQTADRLRTRLNARHPQSNPLLHDHFTDLGVISYIITDPPNARPPSAKELRKLRRIQLSSVTNPMTVYSRLKSSGELETDSCIAILSNPNLTAYNDIELLAIENNIPASYVVAKFMKLPSRAPPDIISKWIREVPSVPSIYQECIRLANQSKPRRNLEATDPRFSLKQCRMDLAAHMSCVLETMGREAAFRRWVSWTRKATPNKLTLEMRKSLLKIPSLQLLRQALQSDDPSSAVVEQVGMLLDWDETIVNMPSQNEFRERVISFLLDALQKPGSCPSTAERVLRILDAIPDSLGPERYLYATDVAVRKLTDITFHDRLLDVEWVKSFIARTKENLSPLINLSQRGQLDRLIDRLEDMGIEDVRERSQLRWRMYCSLQIAETRPSRKLNGREIFHDFW